MLHLLNAQHDADNCAASHPAIRDKYLPHLGRVDDVAAQLGVKVEGGWTDMPGHLILMVVDAPNAHAVTQLAMELHLMDWNTVTVRPVLTMQEATERASSREI